MIAKIPEKRKDGKTSFKQSIDYVLGILKHREDCVLHVGSQNLISFDTAAEEMEAIASCNTRCKDPVFHFILSWREWETPSFEQADEAVAIALKELDLQDCQAIWALQGDTDNLHLHVVTNRIDPDTGLAVQPNGRWTKKGLEKAAREIELAQGWTVENSGHLFHVTNAGQVIETSHESGVYPGHSQKSRDIEAHTDNKSAVTIAKEQATEIIKTARSWDELHEQLAKRNIKFELSSHGNGAVLNVHGKYVKLSAVVDKEARLPKLEARLGWFQPIGSSRQDATDRLRIDIKSFLENLPDSPGRVFQTANTWRELHEGLARQGVRFRVKNKAAVITLYDFSGNEVSAIEFPSTASRKRFLASVEQYFGKYQGFRSQEFKRLLTRQKESKVTNVSVNKQTNQENASSPEKSFDIKTILDGHAGAIFKSATDWKTLHEQLAEIGIRLRVRRKSATLSILDSDTDKEVHVAFPSTISRELFLSSLEKRLGAFQKFSTREFQEHLPGQKRSEAKVQSTNSAEAERNNTASNTSQTVTPELRIRVKQILKTSKSWAELHARLAGQNVTFEVKGGGAVLSIRGTQIKASSLDRALSLSKLEARLGKFRSSIVGEKIPLSPTERVKKFNNVNAAWEEYTRRKEESKYRWETAWRDLQDKQFDEREDLKTAQKAERDVLSKGRESWKKRREELNQDKTDLTAKQTAERQKLKEKHRLEREKLKKSWFRPSSFQWQSLWDEQAKEWDVLRTAQKTERDTLGKDREGWRNHGAELNQERSVLAGKQAAEKLELKGRQKREREKLKKSRHFFPSFKVWLEMQEDEELACKYRYGAATPILMSGNDEKEQSSERITRDIRDYHAKTFAGRVLWCRSDTPEKADFIDHGRRIVMAEFYDENAVLAAIQLSVQKWGKIKVDGTDENFRQLCVKLAAEHNFRLANEDLAKQVEEKKQEIANQHAEEWLKKARPHHSTDEVRGDSCHKADQKTKVRATDAGNDSKGEEQEVLQKTVNPKKGDFVEFKFNEPGLLSLYGELLDKNDRTATIRFQAGAFKGKTTTVYLDKGELYVAEREKTRDTSSQSRAQGRGQGETNKQKDNGIGL